MGWLITLGVLSCLAVLPLGVDAAYDEDGIRVSVAVWRFSFLVFPRPKKESKKKPEEKPAAAEPKETEEESLPKPPQPPEKPAQPKEKKGGSLLDFIPFVKLAVSFLDSLRRKLRLDILDVKVTLAGGDPCDLATNYGRVWAAVGSLMPRLENWFVIKKRNVDVQCDFTASDILILAHLRLTITVGRALSLVAVYGCRALKEFLILKKKRKGGADK